MNQVIEGRIGVHSIGVKENGEYFFGKKGKRGNSGKGRRVQQEAREKTDEDKMIGRQNDEMIRCAGLSEYACKRGILTRSP